MSASSVYIRRVSYFHTLHLWETLQDQQINFIFSVEFSIIEIVLKEKHKMVMNFEEEGNSFGSR